jgi:hypothetical protein
MAEYPWVIDMTALLSIAVALQSGYSAVSPQDKQGPWSNSKGTEDPENLLKHG